MKSIPFEVKNGEIVFNEISKEKFCRKNEGKKGNAVIPDKERTQNQHNALFLWFGLIEKEAENRGITWNMIIRHIHQLRITKEGLHLLCKELQKALWGTKSTKELKKIGQIDIIQEHFIDLFSKEGMELPPFPSYEDGQITKDGKIKAI